MKIVKRMISLATAAGTAFVSVPVRLIENENKAYAQFSDKYEEEGIDPNDSKIRPVITASKLVYEDASEAAGQVVKISVNVSGEGIEKAYSTVDLHINLDERLEIVKTGGNVAKAGDAISDFFSLSDSDSSSARNDLSFVAAADGNYGKEGTLFTFKVRVPENAKAGDVFPIDIFFKKGESTKDTFCDMGPTDTGRLMEAWTFTNGIYSKYNPSDDPYLVKVNKVGADGYIAIEGRIDTYRRASTVRGSGRSRCSG